MGKQFTFCLLLLAILLSTFGACNRSDEKIIAVIPKGQAHIFWQSVHAGAVAAGREFGVKILWNGPPTEVDYSKQISIVEDFINRHVDGIVLAPTERNALVAVIERAQREGIPVTIFDSGANTDKYVSYVATNNYDGGVQAARQMAKILGGQGNVAIIGVIPGSASTTEREQGFKDTIAREFPQIKIVAFQYGMSDRAKSLQVTEDILTAHPDLNGIFGPNESSAVGAAQAVKGRGLAGKVKIVGFDSSPSLLDDLRDVVIDALVVQNPFEMGYQGVKTIVQHLRGETPPKRIDSGITVVTRDNLNDPNVQKLVNPDLKRYLEE